MKLSDLIRTADLPDGLVLSVSSAAPPNASADPEIARITDDSRALDAATLFGITDQARPYLAKILTAWLDRDASPPTCAAILLSSECRRDPELARLLAQAIEQIPVILETDDVKLAQGLLSAALYRHPAREIQLVGVTGTNGKTTVTRMLFEVWRGLGQAAGVIGTLGALWECTAADGQVVRREIKTGYTTPRAPQLHELLRRMADDGVRLVALEVSSEALSLGRLAGTRFAAAAFTNLTVDHLDFHGDIESYYQAKRLLFTMTAESGGSIIVCAADLYGRRLAAEFAQPPARCEVLDAPFITRLPAPTRFNQWNASLAARLAVHIHATANLPTPDRIAALLEHHADIPGRFVRVPADPDDDTGALYGIVDYAHTPDALENVLRETRALGVACIVCVFGCGGNRDRSKRSLMGAIAGRLADVVVVCDDNPRQEDPAAIRAEILRGVRETKSSTNETIFEIGDRRAAIQGAVELAHEIAARPAVVVVAGKGHEEEQIFATTRIPFSDAGELRAAFDARNAFETKNQTGVRR